MTTRRWLWPAIAVLMLAAADAGERRALVGYYPSWQTANVGALAATPAAYTHVILAFAQPSFTWNGHDWAGTGLQFAANPATVKATIAALQARGIKVLLAVGGATYNDWAALAAEAGHPGPISQNLARFIADMGLDGLDVDYETEGAGPAQIAEYRNAVLTLSQAAGPDKLLSLAAWSTGADCAAGSDLTACGGKASHWNGRAERERRLFADRSLFAHIGMIDVMSYDAGVDQFDPVKAWTLYRTLVPATITLNIGFEISPESWGESRLVASDANAVCPGSIVKADQFGNPVNRPYSIERSITDGPLAHPVNRRDGAMLWHLIKTQALPACGAVPVVSPSELERTARDLLDQPAHPGEDRHDP